MAASHLVSGSRRWSVAVRAELTGAGSVTADTSAGTVSYTRPGGFDEAVIEFVVETRMVLPSVRRSPTLPPTRPRDVRKGLPGPEIFTEAGTQGARVGMSSPALG